MKKLYNIPYMVCPFCQLQETSVVDSRKNSEGTSIRRRRNCSACNLRFTTYEKASIGIIVKKRTGIEKSSTLKSFIRVFKMLLEVKN